MFPSQVESGCSGPAVGTNRSAWENLASMPAQSKVPPCHIGRCPCHSPPSQGQLWGEKTLYFTFFTVSHSSHEKRSYCQSLSYAVESECDISDHVLRCQQGGEGKKPKWRCQLLRTRTRPGQRVRNHEPSQRHRVALREALTKEVPQRRRLPTRVVSHRKQLICPNLLLPVSLSYSERGYTVTRHLSLLPTPGFSVS